MDPTPEEVEAGHAFYTRRALAVYDLAILGFFSRVAWRCPASRIQAHYDEHISASHLDIGVGTGYFLHHARFPVANPRVALMDPNQHCLDAASRKLATLAPTVYRADVLQPITIETDPFASIGINYVLHCLPGDIRSKGTLVFEHVKPLLDPGGVVFGATLLSGGVPRNWFSRRLMRRNNGHGIFSNELDDLDGLTATLDAHFAESTVAVVGCVALFSARV